MTRSLRIELRKLLSARGTWVLFALAVLAAALAAIGTTVGSTAAQLATIAGQRTVAHTAGTGGIFVLVLGILTVTNEYRYGTIVHTTLGDPRRIRTFLAKALTVASAALVIGVLAVTANVVAGAALMNARGASYKLGDKEIWSTFVGSVGWALMYAFIGVAIGAVVRKGPPAIIGALAWLLVLEQLLGQVVPDVRAWFPGAIGEAIGRVPGETYLLTMWQGALVAVAYVLAASIGGLAVTRHKDV